jgi:hypothetical protein
MLSTDLCPWLGTAEDKDVRLAAPSGAHLCFAQKRPTGIGLEYQAEFCFTVEHKACPHFREPPAPPPLPPANGGPMEAFEEGEPSKRKFPWLLVALWVAAIAVAAAAIYLYLPLLRRTASTVGAVASATASASPTALPPATPTPFAVEPSPTYEFLEPTGTPTPFPGGSINALSPDALDVGWVASDEDMANHLGDSFLYSGVFAGVVYHGVIQFDLSALPRGAEIQSGALELVGLDGRRLAEDGAWEVRILDPQADEEWARKTYQEIHNAPVSWTLSPVLGAGDLAPGKSNVLDLPGGGLDDLEQRLLDEHFTVSFRIDGPIAGQNCVFAWDTGYGAATQGQRPRLWLSVGPAPKTPVPSGTPVVVVVTSTPTPANVVTAAVLARTATAVTRTKGQPTPTSAYEWTATPPYVVTNTPAPANQATADHYQAIATAVALTTGTFTPTPAYQVTATATPWMIPVDDITPTPTLPLSTPAPPLPAELSGKIVYLSDRAGDAGPWVMNSDGGGVGLLTAAWPYAVLSVREPFSPDGSQLAYASTYEGQSAIMVRSAGQTSGRPIVVFEAGPLSSPAWSPTGNRIAFVSGSGIGAQLWLISASGSGLRELTPEGWGAVAHPTFSPDGRQLAFSRGESDGQRQVWVMDIDGTHRRNLSRNPYDERDPVWAK